MSNDDTGTVQLGDFSFNPVTEQDFRLNIEGASKTGKSNTVAVMMEDLADATIPTLIIERLGILSSVRKEDERMVVVGAQPEEGIDLAIPMDQLDRVVDLMFDRSLKVILDVSTYDDTESEEHRMHLAAATVLKELNRRARENLRTGNRMKCLVVVDEVHMLAPQTGIQHLPSGEYVKRCKGQLVKVATEGGNKGINLVCAYQRRAYTTKGIVSQADNYVIHRLHKTDRSDAAKEIGCSEDDIKNLATGEVLVYGDITNQRLIGPTKVRKRRSPDPREAQFELPEPSGELGEAIEQLQSQIEVDESEREARKTRIEKLEEERDRLKDRVEELEQDQDTQRQLIEAIQKAAQGGEVDPELQEEVERLEELKQEKQGLQDQLESKNSELDEVRSRLADREERIDELEAELTDRKEFEIVRDEIESSARSILRQLGAENPDAEEARERIQELESEVKDLREEKQELEEQGAQEVHIERLEDYQEFLANDVVKEQIQQAYENGDASQNEIKAVLATIKKKRKPVDYQTIADHGGYSNTASISRAVSALEAAKVASVEQRDGRNVVDFNMDGINEMRQLKKLREETEKDMEEMDDIFA